MTNKQKAFTLVELLVVIVIVGVLAAILLPTMTSVREQGRRITCLNNLRQHGIAWHLYLDEHNYAYSLEIDAHNFGGKSGIMGINQGAFNPSLRVENRVLNRYLEIRDDLSPGINVFRCPDDIKVRVGQPGTSFDYFGNSYEANTVIFSYMDPITFQPAPRSFSSITLPKDRVYIECCYEYNLPGHGGKGKASPLVDNIPVMVLFLDGHVKGPYLKNEEFGWNPASNAKVLWDTNGTAQVWD